MSFKTLPLRIFVYEYITGGGLVNEAISPSLAREGRMMLHALVRDLSQIPGVEVVTSRDLRFEDLHLPVTTFAVRDALHAKNIFHHCTKESDATWIIAPESNSILEKLSGEVVALGRILIGSPPEAIAIAADKLKTSRLLLQSEINAIPTYSIADLPSERFSKWVGKPRGAEGCMEARIFDNHDQVVSWINGKTNPNDYVFQPFIEGEACSLSILCRDREAILLGCNRQHVEIRDHQFYYLGGQINALDSLEKDYLLLANKIVRAIPGLWGYVGVDFILSANGPMILEVNPRLTTSYVGLHESINVNPAALVLSLFGNNMPMPKVNSKFKPVNVDLAGLCVA